MSLRGTVLRLDPRRRIATIQLPRIGEGTSFRTDVAMPGEALATAVQFGHGLPGRRTVGAVTAVRPRKGGTEVDVHVTGDSAWQRLGERSVRVDVGCSFAGSIGPNPTGGRVDRVAID
jgi:hypothetical protein